MINKNDRITFSDRIKKIIELSGSAEKLANISGMSSRVIGQYLAGKSDPTRLKLIALADAAQVNIEWLATGNGPMTKEERELLDLNLLTAVIEVIEQHAKETGQQIESSEKADMIGMVYELVLGENVEGTEGRDTLKAAMKEVIEFTSVFDQLLDKMTESEDAMERGRKILIREFRVSLGRKESESLADGLLTATAAMKAWKKRPPSSLK